DRLDRVQLGAFGRDELMLNRQKPFGDDVQLRRRHQVMNIRHTPGERVVDRNHGERRTAAAHRGEGVLERGARQRLVIRIGLLAGNMRIRARLALKGDLAPLARFGARFLKRLLAFLHDRPVSMARAFSKSSGVSTPSGTASMMATSMRMPASS